MKRNALIALLTLCCAMILQSCGEDGPTKGSKLKKGDLIPSFRVEMNNGKTITSNDFNDRGGMILFFHTGCTDCRIEFPRIQAAYETFYPDSAAIARDEGPLFVCIARNQVEPDIIAYWIMEHLTLPYSPQKGRAIYDMFANQDIPRIYIVGPDLRVRELYGPSSNPSTETIVNDLRNVYKP